MERSTSFILRHFSADRQHVSMSPTLRISFPEYAPRSAMKKLPGLIAALICGWFALAQAPAQQPARQRFIIAITRQGILASLIGFTHRRPICV